jgi:hypothetical protein
MINPLPDNEEKHKIAKEEARLLELNRLNIKVENVIMSPLGMNQAGPRPWCSDTNYMIQLIQHLEREGFCFVFESTEGGKYGSGFYTPNGSKIGQATANSWPESVVIAALRLKGDQVI